MRSIDNLLGPEGISAAQPNGDDSEQQAMSMLNSLRYGCNQKGICGMPALTSRSWARVVRMARVEGDDGAASLPVGGLAAALFGLSCAIDVAIRPGDDGLALFMGFPSDDKLRRARAMLAPNTVLEPVDLSFVDGRFIEGVVQGQAVVGITHRVQAGGDVESVSVGSLAAPVVQEVPVLDRLASIPGRWALLMHCVGVPSKDYTYAMFRIAQMAQQAQTRMSVTRLISDVDSSTIVSDGWRTVLRWLNALRSMLAHGMASGLWSVDQWAVAPDEVTGRQVAAALHASLPEQEGFPRETLDCACPQEGAMPPTSFLTSMDLGTLLAPPRSGIPGVDVRRPLPVARCSALSRHDDAMTVGHYLGVEETARIDLADLEGHAFICGTTGSGKSTTVRRILAELWNRRHIPFLVLDPVKDDYGRDAACFEGGLRMVRGRELAMNLMQPWAGETHCDHIASVASAFKASFSMPMPTPYVVTQLFDRAADTFRQDDCLSLFDVRDMLPDLVHGLGYAPEVESNVKAAIVARLDMLLAPQRAARLCWPDSSMVENLLERPTVVTLGDLPDDEERGFLVMLLAQAVRASALRRNARVRGKTLAGDSISHVLVLEEAHRVMPQVNEDADPEAGSARRYSARMLAGMLAEVRGLGEQVLVVDQSAQAVAQDVVRNTNLKIAHRLVGYDDQRAMAAAIGLPERDAVALGELSRGQALMSTRLNPVAQAIVVEPLWSSGPGKAVSEDRRDSGYDQCRLPDVSHDWPCCKGEGRGERHFRALPLAGAAASVLVPMIVSVAVRGSSLAASDELVQDLRAVIEKVGRPDIPIDCVAWAGMRALSVRITSASGASMAPVLSDLYDVWRSGSDGTMCRADTIDVLQAMPRRQLYSMLAREVLEHGPRNGLRALRNASWRANLDDSAEQLRRYRRQYTSLVGGRDADEFVHALLDEAIHQADLDDDCRSRIAGAVFR